MDSSAGNLKGTITAVRVGSVMTELDLQVEPGSTAAVIPTSAFERLAFAVGDRVTLIVNPTVVILGK